MAPDRWQGAGRLVAGGKALEWAGFGAPTAGRPVIVLLHEGLGCLACWRDFPERLARETGHAVFAFSRAGYGASDPADLPRPLDYMTREAEDVLPDVLHAVDAPGYILMGHSDGATIAAIYAGTAGDGRVRGLVLMAPHFFTEPMGLAAIAETKTRFETSDMKARMAKYHRDPEATFRGWNDAWLDPGFVSWNVEEVIDGFSVPVLVLQGADDQYGTLAQVNVVEARSPAPVEVAVIDDCRHALHRDQPEAVLAAVPIYLTQLGDAVAEKACAR